MSNKRSTAKTTRGEEIADADVLEEVTVPGATTVPPEATPPPPPPDAPPPAWVTGAKKLSERTADANAAWHDFFKEPLPAASKAKWSGSDADYSLYEGGRVLVTYREGGWSAVMSTPPEKKTAAAGRPAPRR